MESCYSPFTYSQSLCDFNELLKYSTKTDDKMERVNEPEKMQFCDCDKNKEVLAKREELVWQREDLIHTRERDLRERELILVDKEKKILEKQRQLKCLEEKVDKTEDKHSSGENSTISSISNGEHLSKIQNEEIKIKTEVLSKKMELLLEKEKIVSEKTKNIEMREQNILSKEKFMEDEKVVLKTERELIAEKMCELASREQIIKNNEGSKLKALYEDKKTTDDMIELLSQKEKALSIAAEIMQDKERVLNERENMFIEKERNIINLINKLNEKYIFNEHPNRRNEIFEKFDEIFNEKLKVIVQRENTIRKDDLVLKEKWKKYNEAKELLESEEANLSARKSTFEKDVQNLRCWEMFHEKPEIEIMEKCENSDVGMRRESSSSQCFLEGKSNSIPNVNMSILIENKNIHDQNGTSDLKCQEISRNELFQSLNQEKESFQNSLFKEEIEIAKKELEIDHTEKSTLCESVQSFFNKIIQNEKFSDTESASRISGENSHSSETLSATVGKENIILAEIHAQNDDIGLDITTGNTTKHTHVGEEGSIQNLQHSIFNSNSNKERITDSSYQEIQITSKAVEAKSEAEIYDNNNDVNKENKKSELQSDGSTSQKCINETIYDKRVMESESLKSNTSTECEIKENGHDTPVINNICSDASKNLSQSSSVNLIKNLGNICPGMSNSVSRSSSVSSVRSATSSISDQSFSQRDSALKKTGRDALLKAISNKNFLETAQLLETKHISLKARDDQGRTAFLLAVESGNKELVQRLIKMRAEMRVSDYRGNSALHIATMKENSEMVLFLLQNQLNPRLTNNDGYTVLQLASKMNNKWLVDILKNYT